jgi:hypothetical protein
MQHSFCCYADIPRAVLTAIHGAELRFHGR